MTLTEAQIDEYANHMVLMRDSYLDFVAHFTPNYVMDWFQVVLCDELQAFVEACERGESPRMILEVPFRHGKTLHAGERLIPFGLGRNPDKHIIYGTYGQDLSDRTSKRSRAIIDSQDYGHVFPELELSGHTRSSKEWEVEATDLIQEYQLDTRTGGAVRATSVGGAITGFGASLFAVFDDLIKDAEAAESETIRQSTWEWFTSTALSRIQAGAGALLMATRWHVDDPTGRVETIIDPEGNEWRKVSFPAIAEENEEHRKVGEALCPAIMPVEEIERKRRELGDHWYHALMQQRPQQRAEAPFKFEYWSQRYHDYNWDDIPHTLIMIQDQAYRTGKKNDHTCTIIGGCDAMGEKRIFFSEKRKMLPADRIEYTMELMRIWRPRGCLNAYLNATDDAMQNQYEAMKRDKDGLRFNIHEIKYGIQSKDSRIEEIDGYKRELWFDRESNWLVADLCNWYRGKDKDDDGPDALQTFCIQAKYIPNQKTAWERPKPKDPMKQRLLAAQRRREQPQKSGPNRW